MNAVGKLVGILVLGIGLFAATMPDEAWGRAGGGGSMGSRGSRSFSSPSRSYTAPSRPSTPSTQPLTQPQPAPAGGFLRSLGGGILGGLLGGMLFHSLGFAGGFGGSGGGFGIMDLVLLAGIGYLIFWMVRRGRKTQEATATAYGGRMLADQSYAAGAGTATLEAPARPGVEDRERGLSHLRQMDGGFEEAAFKEWCSDAFFRIQAAWMHRDPERFRSLLSEQMQEAFRKDIEELRAKRQINRLENITIRSVELTEVWQEQGSDYVTVRFLANLLDYTVDESSGKLGTGSDAEPVKFEEFWTWVRPVGPNPWRLAAINQAD